MHLRAVILLTINLHTSKSGIHPQPREHKNSVNRKDPGQLNSKALLAWLLRHFSERSLDTSGKTKELSYAPSSLKTKLLGQLIGAMIDRALPLLAFL